MVVELVEEKQKKCGCLSGGGGGGEKTTQTWRSGDGSGGKRIKMWQWWRYIASLFTELC